MRILFVTRRFPPSTGGMERFAYDLSKALSKSDTIYLLKWGGTSSAWLLVVIPVFFLRSIWTLLTQPVDVIHMQDGVLSVMGAILKLIFRKPLCVVIHGLDITYKNRLYQWMVSWALRRADRVICISNAARDEVIARKIHRDRAIFVPLGITDDLFMKDHDAARRYVQQRLKLDQNAKILLSVGRLVERKGVAWFVKHVMTDIIKYQPQIVLLISGDGNEKMTIAAAIKQKKLSDHVKLLGRTDDKLLRNLYNAADVFVMPNIPIEGNMEGFGRVLLEASLCQIPVVATGIEGIADAIHNDKNGILLETKDAKAFIKECLRFINQPVKAKAFGIKSREYTLDKFNWSNIASRYIEQYKRIV